MAPSVAKAQSGFEPADDVFISKLSDGGGGDWVSLVLSDVGLDMEADHPVSAASLANFPLPDLDDMDFSDLDGSASTHGLISSLEEGHLSNLNGLFVDPSGMLQQMEIRLSANVETSEEQVPTCSVSSCPEGSVGPTLPPFSTSLKENAISHSPESGLTGASNDYPDADARIPTLDSSSDEDSLFFLASDICSKETASPEIENGNLVNVANTTRQGDCGESFGGIGSRNVNVAHANVETLQSSSSQPNSSTCSEKRGKSGSIGNASRKRKHLDRMSRSSTPEEMAVNSSEKVENSMEGRGTKDEEDERRQARLMRNRESAQLSRQRKKVYVDELEEKIKTMASTIAELNNAINLISAENINLRRQLGLFGPPPVQSGGMANVAPWMGAYPPGPMMGSRFIVPGAHAPVVPIPRWKSQQPPPAKKTKTPQSEPQEKNASSKASKKTKKVAGVAAAGLFFFMFFMLPVHFKFLGLRPIVQKESKVWSTAPWHMDTGNVAVRAGARVLTGLSEERDLSLNEQGTRTGFTGSEYLKAGENYWDARRASQGQRKTCDTTETHSKDYNSGFEMNGSVPLAATLFVPRNHGLVRIQGNLIIHSVLAGDKAADSLNQTNEQNVRIPALYDRGSALRANLKALAIKAAPEERVALGDLQRALQGKLRFGLDGGGIKSLKEDGSLQQWFLEDFTGPVFSSGMCTEVFHFEISPAASSSPPGSGSHVRDANNVLKNKSASLQDNGPRKAGRSVARSGKSRSYAVPLPPIGHKVIDNTTSKNHSFAEAADKEFAKQKHGSGSVVVSVLAGPELGEQSKLSRGNGLSRIFVVVLIDSVKYVTYSCMLPSAAAESHYEMVVA